MLDGLNKEQISAVKHIDGPMLVMAGAGSGKTKVLTTRMVLIHIIFLQSLLLIKLQRK